MMRFAAALLLAIILPLLILLMLRCFDFQIIHNENNADVAIDYAVFVLPPRCFTRLPSFRFAAFFAARSADA